MKIWYNTRVIPEEQFSIGISDRSFRYGDGLFETIIVENKKIQLLGLHLQRLKAGVSALGMEAPKYLNVHDIQQIIFNLLQVNGINRLAKVRIQVWRSAGGYYTPANNMAHILISVNEYQHGPYVLNKVGFAEDITVAYSKISSFKSCNALPYVLAGIEMRRKKLDDILLTDHRGCIAEASSSNVFWIREGKFFTPSLCTGCIAGTMRAHILHILQSQHLPVVEIAATKDVILEANSVFLCNVTGVYPIKDIEDHTFITDTSIIKKLKGLVRSSM